MIAARAGRIVLLSLQASGASEYPINYTYEAADKRARQLEKRRLKLEQCERIIDQLRPERILFFAGPPVFLHPDLRHFNERCDSSVFPDQRDVLEHFACVRPDIAARALFLLPSEEASDQWLFGHTDRDDERLLPYTAKEQYLDDYAARRAEEIRFAKGALPDIQAMHAHFDQIAKLSDSASNAIGGSIVFLVEADDNQATFTIDFTTQTARLGGCDDAIYALTVPASLVKAVLGGDATWDDAFLSLRVVFDEQTDRYVARFKTLLKYMDAGILDALEDFERRIESAAEAVPMMEVDVDGCRRLIQRTCAHAGTDLLQHGVVDATNGSITCMLHRFRFDLKTGECLNAKGYRLRIE
jgi:UDP-MurNAc hydroxylase